MNKTTLPQMNGIVSIAHNLHATSQEALDAAINQLSQDYDIENCMDDKTHPHRGWFASLKKDVCQSMAKCEYCNHLNETLGCKVHGFTCKGCGKVIYQEYLHKSTVDFYIRNDPNATKLRFMIHSYDNSTKTLFVYDKPQKSHHWFSASLATTRELMNKHNDFYERVKGPNGEKLLKIYCPKRMDDDVKINVAEISRPPGIHRKDEKGEWIMDGTYLKYPKSFYDETNRRQFYTEVEVYKGQEFTNLWGVPGCGSIPVPNTVMIYDTFKDAPAKRNNKLSRRILQVTGQVADCGYYYQDGSTAFIDVHFKWMATFIKYFTDLDAQKFEKEFLPVCAVDGPGFIQDLAFWVEEQTGVEQYVENRSNFCNTINAIANVFNGKKLSYREQKAAVFGLKNKKIKRLFATDEERF